MALEAKLHALYVMPVIMIPSTPVVYHSPQPRLLDQVREVIRFEHYSSKTEEAYVYWVRISSSGMVAKVRCFIPESLARQRCHSAYPCGSGCLRRPGARARSVSKNLSDRNQPFRCTGPPARMAGNGRQEPHAAADPMAGHAALRAIATATPHPIPLTPPAPRKPARPDHSPA